MPKPFLLFLDGMFFVLHAVLIAFNVFGWIPKKSRRLNLICLLATAVSWLLMGLWHGIGYCVLTDWHWQVRNALGIHDSGQSYIELLVRVVTGWRPPASLVQAVAGTVFAVSLVASISLNLRDRRLSHKAR